MKHSIFRKESKQHLIIHYDNFMTFYYHSTESPGYFLRIMKLGKPVLEVDGLYERRHNRDTLRLVELDNLLANGSDIYRQYQQCGIHIPANSHTGSSNAELLVHLLVRA